MLPSIRLIAATFFCGFVVVFAGLRIAASLNDIHEGLPVMAAHAAPIQAAPNADPAMRRGQSAVPVIYDLRFVAANTSLAPTLASLAPAPPLDITPPAIERVTREELPAPSGATVAAAQDDGPVGAAKPQSPAPAQPAAAPVEAPTPAVETAPHTLSEP